MTAIVDWHVKNTLNLQKKKIFSLAIQQVSSGHYVISSLF